MSYLKFLGTFMTLMSLVSAPLAARADGGIGALGGMLDALLVFISVIGLFLGLLLGLAISDRRRATQSSFGQKTIVALNVTYALVALFFFAASEASAAVTFTGGTVALIVALLCLYVSPFTRSHAKDEPG